MMSLKISKKAETSPRRAAESRFRCGAAASAAAAAAAAATINTATDAEHETAQAIASLAQSAAAAAAAAAAVVIRSGSSSSSSPIPTAPAPYAPHMTQATVVAAAPPAAKRSTLATSIGLGIHSEIPSSLHHPAGDASTKGGKQHQHSGATEAAVKAVADALERGQISTIYRQLLQSGVISSQILFLHVKLGVPSPGSSSSAPPLPVDTGRVYAELLRPLGIPVFLPLQIVIGGLDAAHSLTVVASLSLQAHDDPTVAIAAANRQPLRSPPEQESQCQFLFPPSRPFPMSPTAEGQPSIVSGGGSPMLQPLPAPPPRPPSQQQQQPPPRQASRVLPTKRNHLAMRQQQLQQQATSARSALRSPLLKDSERSSMFQRGDSMDVLARVSAEIHGEEVVEEEEEEEEDEQEDEEGDEEEDDGDYRAGSGTVGANYRKLPPGVTPKKNKRLFVKHQYRDHSREQPRPNELDLAKNEAEAADHTLSSSTPPKRTTSKAFPVMLHETLKQIEDDGYGNIVGWLPHGRSFRIFKQEEFMDIILPRYFVMTKARCKTSFLRQLNLYGFTRFCGLGPDQGSYYHEYFLRGMIFLCRRMSRMKVNGNGIRSAGDPDNEPNLSLYPPCPPEMAGRSQKAAGPAASVTSLSGVSTATTGATHALSPPRPPPSPPSNSALKSDNTRFPLAAPTRARSPVVAAVSARSPIVAAEKNSLSDSSKMNLLASVAAPGKPQALPARVVHRPKIDTAPLVALKHPSQVSSVSHMIAAASMIDTSSIRSSQVGFPLKLQRILDKLEAERLFTDLVSWQPHGRAFKVKNSSRFVHEVMPLFFTMSKFSSFQRQLHMYSFTRITSSGSDKGAYWHPLFMRGAPELAMQMHRTRIRGTGTRKPGNPSLEPDFSTMRPVPRIVPGTRIDIPHEASAAAVAPSKNGAGASSSVFKSYDEEDASRTSDAEEDTTTEETDDETTEQE